MPYLLTHYGHRRILHLARSGALDEARKRDDVHLLCRVFASGTLPDDASPLLAELATRGLVEHATEIDPEAAQKRYDRNPLEHVSRVVFEYTTLCNLDCVHCRNHNLEARADADPAALRRVVDAALPIGVDRFDFIGGEVTLYGKGWLDLVSYARERGGAHASVITSGWFLGERDFLAAGKRYRDDHEYLEDLRARGLTHVVMSLDGPEEVHDRCRQVPGLYQRVIAGIEKTRAAGLIPRVSVVIGLGVSPAEGLAWIGKLARLVYGDGLDERAAASRLVADESNYVSNLIDIGGVVQLRRSRADLAAFSDDELRCKNFFRPSPTMRIKATGEISLCPLVEGGDGYGNVRERHPIELWNRLHEALPYRLHAERRLGEARRFVDPEVFDGRLGHVCSARVALNMIAVAMERGRVSPDDRAAIRAINLEVAEKMGLYPREIARRANGQARPG